MSSVTSFDVLRSWYQQTSNLGSKCIHRSDIIRCFKLRDYLFFFPPSVCSSSAISSVTAPDEGWNITTLVVQLHQIQNMLILQLKSWEKVLWPNFTRKIVVSAFHVMFQEGTLLALPVSLTGPAEKYCIQNITICLLCCSDITYSILFEAVTTLLVFFSYQLFHKDILRDGLIYQHIMKGRWWDNTHRQVSSGYTLLLCAFSLMCWEKEETNLVYHEVCNSNGKGTSEPVSVWYKLQNTKIKMWW